MVVVVPFFERRRALRARLFARFLNAVVACASFFKNRVSKKERKEIWGEKGGGSFSVSFNIVLFPQSDISIQVCKPDERR